MTKDDIIRMAQKAGFLIDTHAQQYQPNCILSTYGLIDENLERFAHLVAATERVALEAELLKLKKGVAANSEYIQGRWDLIGEFQDIIRARGNRT